MLKTLFEQHKYLLVDQQVLVHVLLVDHHHHRAQVFHLTSFALQLVVAAFNVPPDLFKVVLHSASDNIMHKHIQRAPQRKLINAQALAVHPVVVKAENVDAISLQHETVLETMR